MSNERQGDYIFAGSDRLDQARRDIAAILAQLEKDTGLIVRDLSLKALDVTTCEDTKPFYLIQVQIMVERVPGHDWDV